MRVWEEAPFHEGDMLELPRWEEVLQRTNLIRTRGRALSLLARSEHSRFLLRQKLLKRGHEPEHVEPVLDELAREGALSDERFAESWVRSRIRSHPEGRSHLVAGLRNRGVESGLADAAVDRVLEDEGMSMAESARSYAERLTRRRALSEPQLADRLHRRGFSTPVVRAVIRELASDDALDGG